MDISHAHNRPLPRGCRTPLVLRDGQVGARGEDSWALPAVSPCPVPPCGDQAILVAWRRGAPWEAGQPHRDPCGARMAASEMHPDLLGTATLADATFSSQPELPTLGPESPRRKPPTGPYC